MSDNPKGDLAGVEVRMGQRKIPLFDFLKCNQHRSGLSTGEQLEFVTKAARIDDKVARELVLSVLGRAQYIDTLLNDVLKCFKSLEDELARANEELMWKPREPT